MSAVPLPADENQRLQSLLSLEILDTEPEAEFDALVHAASAICGVPIAWISLVDANRLWFKASIGWRGITQVPREAAFCASTVLGTDIFEIEDAARDARFADNPLVRGRPGVRFYAGAPLRLSDGANVGSLCVIDRKPHKLDARQREALQHLARLAVRLLETRAALARETKLRNDLAQQQEKLRRSEHLLHQTAKVAAVGGWELDVHTRRFSLTDETCRIHGRPPGYQPTVEELIADMPPADQARLRSAVRRTTQEGVGWDIELPLLRPDGSRAWIRMIGQCQFVDGKPGYFSGTVQEIDKMVEQRQLLQRQLAEEHELLRVTLNSIADAVITTDANGLVTWLNPVAERMTGWLTDEARGRPLEQVFRTANEDTREDAENPVSACLTRREVVSIADHTVLISRDGEEFGIEDSAAPILNDSGECLGAVLVFHDVTEQRRLSGEMSFRASHDALTGLVNRSEFEARLRRTLHTAHEDRSHHALLYIDLDQFKLVNDACGHSAGDELLQQVAKLLADTVRSRDTLARLGGDEFAMILEHCTVEQAQRVAQQVCERMEDFRFIHEGQRFRIGSSIGLVPVDARWNTISAVLQAADSACYAAKEAGRNRIHVWYDSDHAIRSRQGEMQWATRLAQAIDEHGFELFAQRIEPANGADSCLHAEVLLRLPDGRGGYFAPGLFLPAAERFHLAARVDRWVLQRVIDLIKRQGLEHVSLLSVNLSGQSLGDRAFHKYALDNLQAAGADVCNRLCLEITETAAVTNPADASLFVERARALGVRVALDDFGAGASSFGYLKSMKVDLIKIDGHFIKDMIEDPLDAAAVRSFIDVAKVLGLKTVAEFVDRPALLERLRAMGIDYVQGFLLHTPEPIEALQAPARPPLHH
jgi:diguanylate cyclase (GGDEF)-like protein/PAS domain S-box-containing protein